MPNQTASPASRSWGPPLDQRFQKRRRVNSHPRAASSSSASFPSTSTSFSSSSASFSSSSASFSSTSATTSSMSSRSSSISKSQSFSSASRSVSSDSGLSSHPTSSTGSSQSRASSKTSSVSRSSSQSTSSVASQTTSLVSRTSSSASLSTFRSASTSVFLSTVIDTVSGSTTTVVATSTGTIGTSSSNSGTSFAHNVGAIVGIAIGSGVAVLLGAALLFFTCKHFRRQRTPAAEVELAPRAPADVPSTDAGPQSVPEAAPGASSYHYTRARPRMPPTPPSSSSMAGLIGRLRGGRASTTSSVPVLESTTPLAQPSPVAPIPHYLSSSHSLAPPRMPGTPPPGSPRLPGTPPPPGSPRLPLPQHSASPRPSSLLNPRVNFDVPSAPSSPAPGMLGWRPPGPEQPPPLSVPEPPTQEQESPRSPVGLLRPSLAVLQFESSRTLGDHEDYSRPIGARVNMRMESDITVPSGEEDE